MVETSRPGTGPEDLIGKLVDGRYKVLEAMAAGSMGAVFKAERVPVGKLVAIKFLHASFANDTEFQTRFERETRVMSKLAHPNCVSVVDFGTWQGAPYIVMDYIAGTTLRAIIDRSHGEARGALAPARALAIARQIAAGLAHAHAQGVVHRDVKPANIMISEEIGTGEHVRILDFGLARLRGAVGRDATQSNVVVGTPNYMAPEQTVGGGTIDARTDVYAVGVVLFEMVAGERPFQAEDTLALLGMHRAAPIPKLADRVDGRAGDPAEIPDGLQGLVEKAMAKVPDDRYQTAIELADAITEVATRASGVLPRPPELPGGARPSGKHAVIRKGGRTDLGIAPTMVDIDGSDAAVPAPRATPAKASSSKAGAVLAVLVLGGGAAAAWYVKGRSGGEGGEGSGSAIASRASGDDHGVRDPGPGTASASVEIGPGSGTGSPVEAKVVDDGSGSGSGSAEAGSGSGSGSDADAGSASPDAGSGSAPGPGSGSSVEIDMSADPVNARQPDLPGAGSGDKAEDEAADAPKDVTEVEKKPPPAPTLAKTIDDAIKLIKDGKRELALASLRQLATAQPKNWYIPFVLGNLYFDQLWWGVAMDYYTRAIKLNGAVRGNGIMIRNIIRMLASTKTQKRAGELLRFTIGKPAVPYLQAAARSDENPTVKRAAGQLVRVIR
ncbi:MAG: protein kinase [Deltaproteobacteria bacterium]|nr:protein kinase [Deltaproteobacteria bacterium]